MASNSFDRLGVEISSEEVLGNGVNNNEQEANFKWQHPDMKLFNRSKISNIIKCYSMYFLMT